MNASLPDPARLRELDRVRLLGRYAGREGTLPVGQDGTIVHRYRGGEAFEVEFTHPAQMAQMVVTLRADEIERLDGAA